eukprot:TRINITY_DN192_c7_g1_i1.p1 TRINITY_DN192_c7_g1~~TRINITY_DN192_c7_g1_i1.p1  ORF type:complete len:275 (+),score=50.30 TRINITY_DN192_c7_g1_i1:41-865(+)
MSEIWRLPSDFAKNTPTSGKVAHKTSKAWDFLKVKSNVEELQKGSAFYGFNMAVGTNLGKCELDMIDKAINLTSLSPDSEEAKMQPHIDVKSPEDLTKYVFLLNKAMYVLPKVQASDVTPEKLASVDWQKACQPGTCKVWNDCDRKDTFRLTKTIIRAVYKVTIQFRCTWVPKEHLPMLASLSDNLQVDQAILLERTKRDFTVQDSTVKVRSLLLCHILPEGGMVVTNVTAVANTSIPSFLARLVDSLGWAGASEVAETAEKTRKFTLSKLQKS